MARVAESTCATCHHVKPRTEMREVAVSRRVGSRYGISHSRRGNRESASVQYARKFVWVCKGCRAPKSDGLIPWKTLLVLAAAAIAFLWYSDAHTKRKVAQAVGSVASMGGEASTPRDRRLREDAVATAPAEGREAGEAGDAARDYAPPQIAAESFSWDQDAIRDAMVRALTKDSVQKWKADGVKGQAVASSATMDGTTECRNVYATARVEGTPITSPTRTWCREAGGEWTAKE